MSRIYMNFICEQCGAELATDEDEYLFCINGQWICKDCFRHHLDANVAAEDIARAMDIDVSTTAEQYEIWEMNNEEGIRRF